MTAKQIYSHISLKFYLIFMFNFVKLLGVIDFEYDVARDLIVYKKDSNQFYHNLY